MNQHLILEHLILAVHALQCMGPVNVPYRYDPNPPPALLRGGEYLMCGLVYHISFDADGRLVPSAVILPELPMRSRTGGPMIRVLGQFAWDSKILEYRSGRLIPGSVQKVQTIKGGLERVFVPDLGGEVITMDAYLKTYDPQKSVPIYNLPGRIVRASANPPPQQGLAWRQDAKPFGSRQGQPSLALRAFMMNAMLLAPPTEAPATYKLDYKSKWNWYVVMGD